MEESQNENTVIEIDSDCNDTENYENDRSENYVNQSEGEGDNNEQENNENNDDNNEQENNENNDDNNEQENNENNDSEECNSDQENDESNVNGEESNNEQTDTSSNNEDSDDSDKCEDSYRETCDVPDSTRRVSSPRAETSDMQHTETTVDLECTPQTSQGPKYEGRPTWNQTPQSSNAQKKHNNKKWKGKGSNAGGGNREQGYCQRQNYNPQYKSGAGNKNTDNGKAPNSKGPNVPNEGYKNANSPGQQNSYHQKDKNKGGNNQGWKTMSNNDPNKSSNSGNNCNASNGNASNVGGSNSQANKGKDNKNDTFDDNNKNDKNKSNNNNSNASYNNNNNNNKHSKTHNSNNSNNYNKNNNNNNNSKNYNNNNNSNNNKQKTGEAPPFKNILKEAKDVVHSILKPWLCAHPLDSPVLRLHYRLTVLLFVLLYTIIQGCWIWKESIICVYGHNAEIAVPYHIKNFCLTYSFIYEYPDGTDGWHPDGTDGWHPDGTGEEDETHRRYLLFYRWTHLSFMILASVFYVPRILAKTLDNPRLKQLVHDLALGEHRYDASLWEQDTTKMLHYMNNHTSTHGWLYFWLIICHLVALAIDCLVVLYFDYVLQGRFMNLVFSAYPFHREPQFFTDYLSRTFPPFVRCKVERQVLINNEREDELGCHLLLMDIYDKMFVMIWLWLVFLIVSTAITVVALFLWVIPPFNRLFLIIQTDSKRVKKMRDKIVRKYSFSDLYVLHLMKRHRSEAQFTILMCRLIHSDESIDMLLESEKKKSKVSFIDEITLDTDHMKLPPTSGHGKGCAKNPLSLSPIVRREEAVRSRKDASTPKPNWDISFPRNCIRHEYQV